MKQNYGLNNNLGCIVRPIGRHEGNFCIIPESIFLCAEIGFGARLVLGYIVSRPTGWTSCVADIQKQVGLTRSQWIKARNELRKVGCIPHNHPFRLAGQGRKISWQMDVDFTQFYTPAGEKLSTAEVKNEAKNGEKNFHRRFSIDGKSGGGNHRRFSIDGKTCINQEELNNIKKPPPARARGWVVVEENFEKEEDKFTKLGLSLITSKRLTTILKNCGDDQIAIFHEILPVQLAKAGNREGMALALARMASRGELTPPAPSVAPLPPPILKTVKPQLESLDRARSTAQTGPWRFRPAGLGTF